MAESSRLVDILNGGIEGPIIEGPSALLPAGFAGYTPGDMWGKKKCCYCHAILLMEYPKPYCLDCEVRKAWAR